jgi:hypothetical protein
LQTGTVRQGWIQGIYDIVVAIDKKAAQWEKKIWCYKKFASVLSQHIGISRQIPVFLLFVRGVLKRGDVR